MRHVRSAGSCAGMLWCVVVQCSPRLGIRCMASSCGLGHHVGSVGIGLVVALAYRGELTGIW